MAYTYLTSCDNKNLSPEQIEKQIYVVGIDGKPVPKFVQAFNVQGGLNQIRKTNLTKVAFEVKASAGNLLGWNIINPNGTAIYVKFYDIEAADVVVATDAPKLTIMVPANGTVYIAPNAIQQEFETAISVRSCTGIADNDDNNTSCHANILFI